MKHPVKVKDAAAIVKAVYRLMSPLGATDRLFVLGSVAFFLGLRELAGQAFAALADQMEGHKGITKTERAETILYEHDPD